MTPNEIKESIEQTQNKIAQLTATMESGTTKRHSRFAIARHIAKEKDKLNSLLEELQNNPV